VKRAYTAAALKWHPDRHADDLPEERELADWHIREVNSAWEVLRSPSSRADYDDQLRMTSAPRSTREPAGVGSRAPSFTDHLVDPRTDPTEVPGGGLRSSGRRWAPMIVIGVVVVILLIVTAYASHKHPSGSTGVQVQTNRYQVGNCVDVINGPAAVIVPCNQANSGKISATTDYPRPCPDGTTAVPLVEQQLTLCLAT
jgi:hypothetical protein